MSTTALQCVSPVRASEKVADLLRDRLAAAPGAEPSLVRQLRSLESIEARLAAGVSDPDELRSLAALGHDVINEIQRLQLAREIQQIYVRRASSALP